MKNRILSNVLLNRRAMQPSAGPLDGGFWWSEERNAPGRVSFADTVVSLRHTGWFLDSKNDVFELFSARHNKRVRSDISEIIADIRAFEVEFKDLCTRHYLIY